ncbi:MAG: N-acetyltransferase protein [Candidatus Levybacteria bacterium]|nr:N-acetyltransferase protein [Candidatus Levybacteria bacterium]
MERRRGENLPEWSFNSAYQRIRFRNSIKEDTGGGCKDCLNQNSVEIRLADWEKDAKPIADIFNHPSVIEHEAGVAWAGTRRNISRFKAHPEKYIHLSPGSTMTEEALIAFAEDIIIATPDEVRAYFEKLDRVETFVAALEGKVVGTVSLEKPGPTQVGKRTGTIFKLAVNPDAPKVVETAKYGKGIGRSLVRAVGNRAKELSLTSVGASIIKDVEGYVMSMSLFLSEGYTPDGVSKGKDTLGWNYKEGMFVERNTMKFQLQLESS